MADNLSLFNVTIYYKYLEKKESGIHISVCLEVLNLGDQSYKFSISCKIGRKYALSKFFDLSYKADIKWVWEIRDHLNVCTKSKRLHILCTDCP